MIHSVYRIYCRQISAIVWGIEKGTNWLFDVSFQTKKFVRWKAKEKTWKQAPIDFWPRRWTEFDRTRRRNRGEDKRRPKKIRRMALLQNLCSTVCRLRRSKTRILIDRRTLLVEKTRRRRAETVFTFVQFEIDRANLFSFLASLVDENEEEQSAKRDRTVRLCSFDATPQINSFVFHSGRFDSIDRSDFRADRRTFGRAAERLF